MKKLVIDALAFENIKAYGYQEYLFNMLEYFYAHRESILFENITIVCLKSQQDYFERYSNKFVIKSYRASSKIERLVVQTLFSYFLSLKKDDLIIYTANYSSLIKRSNHILVIHDLLFKRKDLFPYRLMRLQRYIYLPISVRLADKVIAISNFTASEVRHYYPDSEKKTCVIYNYFNFKKFPQKSINLNSGDYFISVCSTAFHKNTIIVLKAFEEYYDRGGRTNLLLVGAIKNGTIISRYFAEIKSEVKEKITIYDKISNELLGELYQNSKAYISASLFEGLGMPIVEAMYFNRPLLLSNLSVFREISANKGFYFDPHDANDLANKMSFIDNERSIQVDFSNDITHLFSAENTSNQYIKLINSFHK